MKSPHRNEKIDPIQQSRDLPFFVIDNRSEGGKSGNKGGCGTSLNHYSFRFAATTAEQRTGDW